MVEKLKREKNRSIMVVKRRERKTGGQHGVQNRNKYLLLLLQCLEMYFPMKFKIVK